MVSFLTFVLFSSLLTCGYSASVTCRNEKGSPVDWFINYKLPKLENHENPLLARGLAYTYLFPRASQWALSGKNISSKTSMLGNTLSHFYQNKRNLTYLLYNDEPSPDDFGSSVGHTKGVVMFERDTGIWIVHSIPKFPLVDAYNYPSNGIENGQSIFCITFNIDSLNEIGKQLLYNGPLIYSKNLNKADESKIDKDVASLFTDKPNFVRKEPFQRVTQIRSLGNLKVTSFAKDNQFNKDLYSSLIAPELKRSMFVETWRRGSGTKLDPECGQQFKVQDVLAINMTAREKRKTIYISFSAMEDHSKWAVSDGSKAAKWICIGDINRMESQKRRGGGSLCFTSTPVWQAFNSSIALTDSCERRN